MGECKELIVLIVPSIIKFLFLCCYIINLILSFVFINSSCKITHNFSYKIETDFKFKNNLSIINRKRIVDFHLYKLLKLVIGFNTVLIFR
jgi:replication initiation and membrane attachment protein DnaB